MQFLKIHISQGSVATPFGRDEIFNDSFIANCRQRVPVKEFSKSVTVWRWYIGKSLVALLYGSRCM